MTRREEGNGQKGLRGLDACLVRLFIVKVNLTPGRFKSSLLAVIDIGWFMLDLGKVYC